MKTTKGFLIGSAVAGLLLASAASVGAAPTSTTLSSLRKDTPNQVDTVHWRRWHHCHWRWGRCRGYRYYGYGYRYYTPGIFLGFGGFRHHHHWRHW